MKIVLAITKKTERGKFFRLTNITSFSIFNAFVTVHQLFRS